MEESLEEDIDIVIADRRYAAINQITAKCVKHPLKADKNLTEKIDRVVLNRVLGLPIFLLFMYLTFMFTINVGGAFIDFFDLAAGAIFVDGMSEILTAINTPAWIIGIVAPVSAAGFKPWRPSFHRSASCSWLWQFWRVRVIWLAPLLLWIDSCACSVCPARPLFQCWLASAVMFPRLWRPEHWKTSATAP